MFRKDRLIETRLDRGLETVYAASERLGISPAHWYKLESGEISSPRMPTVRRIARGLGVSAAYLMGDTDDPTPMPEDVEPEKQPQYVSVNSEGLSRMVDIYVQLTPADRRRLLSFAEALHHIGELEKEVVSDRKEDTHR